MLNNKSVCYNKIAHFLVNQNLIDSPQPHQTWTNYNHVIQMKMGYEYEIYSFSLKLTGEGNKVRIKQKRSNDLISSAGCCPAYTYKRFFQSNFAKQKVYFPLYCILMEWNSIYLIIFYMKIYIKP